MQNCNQMHACYLFQQDKHYDLSYDTGDKALQCGRHVDIFKLWLMWRAKVRPSEVFQETTRGRLSVFYPMEKSFSRVKQGMGTLLHPKRWKGPGENTLSRF